MTFTLAYDSLTPKPRLLHALNKLDDDDARLKILEHVRRTNCFMLDCANINRTEMWVEKSAIVLDQQRRAMIVIAPA